MSTFFNDVLSATKNLLHATVNVPFDALHATNAVINAVIGNKVKNQNRATNSPPPPP